MKLPKSNKTIIAIAIPLIVLLCLGVYASREWIDTTYSRIRIERTITQELKPLQPQLEALGFSDFSHLNTECGTIHIEQEQLQYIDSLYARPGDYFECTSGIDRYTVVATQSFDAERFRQKAVELSDALEKNGWHQREDYPTISWFSNLAAGIDYQPDQLNTKTVGNYDCVIDFFTAFSQPAPAAMSVHAFCTLRHN